MEACSDGTFLGKRYFNCPDRRGLFVLLWNCTPDSRFGRGRSSLVSTTTKRLTGKNEFQSFLFVLNRFYLVSINCNREVELAVFKTNQLSVG